LDLGDVPADHHTVVFAGGIEDKYEHSADGDMFTSDVPTHYSPLELNSVWAWGDDVPAALKPPKKLRTLFTVIKRLQSGQITLKRLRLMGKVLDGPGRRWLR
jgi:hypothetical protein